MHQITCFPRGATLRLAAVLPLVALTLPALAQQAPFPPAQQPAEPTTSQLQSSGMEIIAVDAATKTIKVRVDRGLDKNTDRDVSVTSATQLRKEDRSVSAAELKVGDSVDFLRTNKLNGTASFGGAFVVTFVNPVILQIPITIKTETVRERRGDQLVVTSKSTSRTSGVTLTVTSRKNPATGQIEDTVTRLATY